MGEVNMNRVKTEPGYNASLIKQEQLNASSLVPPGWEIQPRAQESEDYRSSNVLEQAPSPVENSSSASPLCPAPLCRQFWKAGNYEDAFASKSRVQSSQNYLHVHPKFLHSNATSHKWAFGAVAELLDNAIDEIPNGATSVIVDKISNPRDGSPALLIQDDGGGMDPEAIRRCMSFGFSDKKSKSSIGRYGNGFKTSTMRLGADVFVFSRHLHNSTLTQSIGLLSYTYLSRKCLDRIVVPMVDYEYNMSTSSFEPLQRHGKEHFESNVNTILQWSPYSTEAELMQQFDDIGSHGTKVIVYNLWFTDDGTLEFDFESDPEDIRLRGHKTEKVKANMLVSEEHIGNRYRYSLRVYLSILYLRVPENFSMVLRGKVVEHHKIAHDLKFQEFIIYRPQTGNTKEEVITTVGFLKEAPHVYLHGFNVYHKNRLILPFWHVVNYRDSRGRGVVGVLEANFVEPTHNKQDFERTSLFQKLETRLKEMTWEYWDYHCGLIGYQVKKTTQAPLSLPHASNDGSNIARHRPVSVDKSSNLGPAIASLTARPVVKDSHGSGTPQHGIKRTQDDLLSSLGRGRRQYKEAHDTMVKPIKVQPVISTPKPLNQQEAVVLMHENKKLRAKCLEYEKTEEELNHKASRLRRELEEAQNEYARMLSELQKLEVVKGEKDGV